MRLFLLKREKRQAVQLPAFVTDFCLDAKSPVVITQHSGNMSLHIESSHAVAYGVKLTKAMGKGSVLINLSDRGDKDMDYIIEKCGIH